MRFDNETDDIILDEIVVTQEKEIQTQIEENEAEEIATQVEHEEVTEAVECCLNAVNDLQFVNHLKANIETYGVTPQIAELLHFENTTRSLFGVENLNDYVGNTQAALEGLKEMVSGLIEKVKKFFKWIWEKITGFFESIGRKCRQFLIRAAMFKGYAEVFKRIKLDMSSGDFHEWLKAHKHYSKTKIIKGVSATVAARQIHSVNGLIEKCFEKPFETIEDFVSVLKQPTEGVDLFKKDNGFSFYITDEGGKVLIHKGITSNEFPMAVLPECGWNASRGDTLFHAADDSVKRILKDIESKKATINFKKVENDTVNDLKKGTAKSDSTEVAPYVNKAKTTINVNTAKLQILIYQMNFIIDWAFKLLQAASVIIRVFYGEYDKDGSKSGTQDLADAFRGRQSKTPAEQPA